MLPLPSKQPRTQEKRTTDALIVAQAAGGLLLYLLTRLLIQWGFPGGSVVKNLLIVQETRVRPLGWEFPLEESRAAHSSALAWRIPWTEDRGGLRSIGSHGVRHG